MNCEIHNIVIKAGHDKCRRCHLGDTKYFQEKGRLKVVRSKRHMNNYWRKHRYCEMGYADCEARGYCNGDC